MTNFRYAMLTLLALSLGGCALGPTELMMVLAIVVILFGASRLPQLGKALGETIKGFRGSLEEGSKEDGKGSDPIKIEEAKVEAEPNNTDKS